MTAATGLASDLRAAVLAGGLSVVYQPLVDLDDWSWSRPPRVVAVEALCRWEHPERGLLPPGEFIAIAESEALVAKIDADVLSQAGAQVRAWQRAGHPVGLSVNASPSHLSAGWVDDVIEQVAVIGLQPGTLALEITESPPPQLAPEFAQVFPRLRAAGVAVSVDDFGASETTAAMLSSLPIDEVKIDRSLTQRTDAEADAVVGQVVSLARDHSWRVVAEGIETEADLDRSRRRGCHRGQGFLLGRPMPAEAVGRMLAPG